MKFIIFLCVVFSLRSAEWQAHVAMQKRALRSLMQQEPLPIATITLNAQLVLITLDAMSGRELKSTIPDNPRAIAQECRARLEAVDDLYEELLGQLFTVPRIRRAVKPRFEMVCFHLEAFASQTPP